MLAIAACRDESTSDVWSGRIDVAFAEDAASRMVWLASAERMMESASPLELMYSNRTAAWSPCGEELALRPFDRGEHLVAVSPAGERELPLGSTGSRRISGPSEISWAPSGLHLAITGEVNVDVGVSPSCGYGEGIFLCELGADRCPALDSWELSGGVSWSPDGDRVVVVRRRRTCTVEPADGETIGPWEVVVHDTERSVVASMPTPADRPARAAWSPTDDRIAIVMEGEDEAEAVLQIWSPDTSIVDIIGAGTPLAGGIAWFPGGERLLVSAATDPPSLLTLDAETGTKLDVLTGFSDATLAPDGMRAIAQQHTTGMKVVVDLSTGATSPAIGERHWWRPRCEEG